MCDPQDGVGDGERKKMTVTICRLPVWQALPGTNFLSVTQYEVSVRLGPVLTKLGSILCGFVCSVFFFLTVLIPFSDTDNIRLELKKNYISMSSFLMNRNLNLALSICLMLLMSREEQNLDPDADRTPNW